MTLEKLWQERIDQFNQAMQEYLQKKKPCPEVESEQGK